MNTMYDDNVIEALLLIKIKERAKDQHIRCLLQLIDQIDTHDETADKIHNILIFVKYMHKYFDDFIIISKHHQKWKEAFEKMVYRLHCVAEDLNTILNRGIEPENYDLYKDTWCQIRDLEYLIELTNI